MPECNPEIHMTPDDSCCDEGNCKQFHNQKLDFPPPPSNYDRQTAMHITFKPGEVIDSFLAAQLRYIKAEIYESDLCPRVDSQQTPEDCEILEYVINHEFK
jgi:hypothetical protein